MILFISLKINEKKRLLNKQEQIKEISIKETGRTGQFAKIETKQLKSNKIEEENTKKQEEKRSISLSRTWYICDCKLTINISDSTKGSAIHQY